MYVKCLCVLVGTLKYTIMITMVTIPVHAACEITTAACRLSVVAEMFLISDGLG